MYIDFLQPVMYEHPNKVASVRLPPSAGGEHARGIRMHAKAIMRFWKKIDRRGENECWPWTASTSNGRPAYAVVVDGQRRNVKAYRCAFFLTHGRWPAEHLHILHSCDNPLCCNPAHLREGTQAENMLDAKTRRRVRCGRAHWAAKLDDDKVRDIRRLGAEGCSRAEIASRFGVSDGPIKAILEGRTWLHVPNDDGSLPGRVATVAHRGRKVKKSKLDEEKVRLIRKLRADGLFLRKIADQLDVGLETVRQVVVGASWKHVK